MAKEEEYKELFLAEAKECHTELDKWLMELEKNPNHQGAVDAIFRITHTLKGNAMGLGYDAIAELSHVLEDLFNLIRLGQLPLDAGLFQTLFRANDVLGQLMDALKTEEKVRYKGILTKLKVVLRRAGEGTAPTTPTDVAPITDNTSTEDDQVLEADAATLLSIGLEAETATSVTQKIALSDMVQVPVRKLDELMNIVGELIIEKDTLLARSREQDDNHYELARLHRLTSDLQYSVMDVRLVQVGFLFNKFHRILRDVAMVEQKKVDLVLQGTESEIDRNVLKTISDSLVHLVRNAVSHGIESPEERLRQGKSERGTVMLRARNEKDTVYIEVADDGHGIDVENIRKKAVQRGLLPAAYAQQASREEVLLCLFEPGFSNSEVVTEVSGRGVGLDVVRSAVESIGGNTHIESTMGLGSTFTLALPSSMAVKPALLFEVEDQEYAIPLTYTEAVVALPKQAVHQANGRLLVRHQGRTLSLVFLRDLFGMTTMTEMDAPEALLQRYRHCAEEEPLSVILVRYQNRTVGLVVDKLLQQKEIVEKKLLPPIHNSQLFSGATVLGTGNVCLVLDVIQLLAHLFKDKHRHWNPTTPSLIEQRHKQP